MNELEPELRPALPALLSRPTPSFRYLLHARAFAIALGIHLLLPDAAEPGWAAPNVLVALGALLLFANGNLLGWALASVGVIWPLLALGDQLTQSLYVASIGIAACALWTGPAAGRAERLDVGLARVVRVLTVMTYALAALHKLNRDFLSPDVSCASQGVVVLARNWGLPAVAWPALLPAWPFLFLLVEVGIAVLLRVRPLLGMIVGVAVHIPLTIVFAPAFAFVVTSGYVAFLGEPELRALGQVLRRRLRLVVALGGVLGLCSFALYMHVHRVIYWFWSAKEVLLWMGLVWLVCARIDRRERFRDAGSWREGRPRTLLGRGALALLVVAWLANALTPYLGLQFHHTAAMLSNLRIDRGCWNSLVFPESMRIVEPYIRIDAAQLGGGHPDHEATLRERLWTTESLQRARRDFCRVARPLHVRGRAQGRSFDVADLCRAWPFGEALLPGFKAFQDNLTRDCPQYCVH